MVGLSPLQKTFLRVVNSRAAVAVLVGILFSYPIGSIALPGAPTPAPQHPSPENSEQFSAGQSSRGDITFGGHQYVASRGAVPARERSTNDGVTGYEFGLVGATASDQFLNTQPLRCPHRNYARGDDCGCPPSRISVAFAFPLPTTFLRPPHAQYAGFGPARPKEVKPTRVA